MDIIPDSSVWFEYYKGNNPYFRDVQNYLNTLNIKTIDPIVGEIVQGALNKNELKFIRDHIKYVPKIEIKDLFEKAGEFFLDKKILSYLDKKFLYE